MDLKETAEKLRRTNMHRRCTAVPHGEQSWVGGYIAGVVADSRSGRVLYAIRTDDGRRIVKVHDSPNLRILEEVMEFEADAPKRGRKKIVRPEWGKEAIEAEIAEVAPYVGRTCEIVRFRTSERTELAQGRIIGILPDKRAQKLFYRVSIGDDRIVLKAVDSDDISIADSLDEVGKVVADKFEKRRYGVAQRTSHTLRERYAIAEKQLKKAEALLELRKKQLAEILEEINAVNGELM